ncbi:hypothetical protein [Bradyrhizobium guangdongense]
MGIEEMYSPRYWLNRAEEFRAKAESCEHAQVAHSLRKVAKNYDELARQAELIRTLRDAAE